MDGRHDVHGQVIDRRFDGRHDVAAAREVDDALHPLLESGILLTAIAAVALNLYFNGGKGDASAAVNAAKMSEAH